ncbi:MAG: hypothetical protein ACYC0K_10200, partial [Thermoleophilia bacterium]
IATLVAIVISFLIMVILSPRSISDSISIYEGRISYGDAAFANLSSAQKSLEGATKLFLANFGFLPI